MPGLMDASWQRLVAAAAETDQQAGQLLHIQEAMAGVDVVAGSADGAVQVRVDRNGALTGIEFTERALRLDPAGLGAAVLDAVHEAKTRIGPRYAEIVASSGADEATIERMIGRYRENHPDRFRPEPAAPAEAPPEQLMTKASAPPVPHQPVRAPRPVVDHDEDEAVPLMQRATNWPG